MGVVRVTEEEEGFSVAVKFCVAFPVVEAVDTSAEDTTEETVERELDMFVGKFVVVEGEKDEE